MVDKDRLDDVLATLQPQLVLRLADLGNREIPLTFRSLADFGPERIAAEVPALRDVLVQRSLLAAIEGALSDIPAFRMKVEENGIDAALDDILAQF